MSTNFLSRYLQTNFQFWPLSLLLEVLRFLPADEFRLLHQSDAVVENDCRFLTTPLVRSNQFELEEMFQCSDRVSPFSNRKVTLLALSLYHGRLASALKWSLPRENEIPGRHGGAWATTGLFCEHWQCNHQPGLLSNTPGGVASLHAAVRAEASRLAVLAPTQTTKAKRHSDECHVQRDVKDVSMCYG